MSQFRNLVFEGGGVKGIAYVGALEVLEQKGILRDVKRIGGTSAGAINAVLLGCGYSNKEQLNIMSGLDFNNFLDSSWGVMRDTARLINEFGWYKGDFFYEWIGGLIKKKLGRAELSFAEFEKLTGRALYLVGTNLSTGFGEIFSHEHTPAMRMVDAVRISMSIPLFFAAIRNARRDVYVDGGLLNNYPIKLFDREKYISEDDRPKAARRTDYYGKENKAFLKGEYKERSPYVYNCQTLGFRLDSKREIAAFRYGDVPAVNRIDDFFDYTKALLRAVFNVQEMAHLHSDDWQRTIYIDTLGISTTDFGITKKKRDGLIESGRKCTESYFKWFETAKGKDAPVNRI
jgi:NTE family protein